MQLMQPTAAETRAHVTGIILAGGRSLRMGGVNKAMLHVQGRPMLGHIIDTLKLQLESLVISAPFAAQGIPDTHPLQDYKAWGLPVVCDPYPDFQGPLSGMLAGMRQSTTPFFMSVPCDTPFIPADLCTRMHHGLLETASDLVFAAVNGHAQPVICLGKTSLAKHLEAFLAGGDRKVGLWQKSLHWAEVDFSDCADTFCNLNTPQDLAQLNATFP